MYWMPFEYGVDQAYAIEMGDLYARFFRDGIQLTSNPNLITNGGFDAGIAGWTDYSQVGASISWDGATQGLKLNTGIIAQAKAGQSVATVIGVQYRLTFKSAIVNVGAIVGSFLHGFDLGYTSSVAPGIHTLVFTATTVTTYIEFWCSVYYPAGSYADIDDVEVVRNDAGILEVVTPYTEAQLRSLRFTQSADILYCAHRSHAIRKLMRLLADGTSWQLSTITFLPPPTYEADMDPSGGAITIGIGAVTGQGVKVYASAAVFLDADVARGIKRVAGLASITAYTGTKEVTVDILNDFAASLVAAGPGTVTAAGAPVVDLTFTQPHGLVAGDYIKINSSGQLRRITVIVDPTHATIDAAFSAAVAGEAWSKCSPMAAGTWFLTGSPQADNTPSAKAPVNAIVTLTLNKAGWRAGDVGKYVRLFDGVAKITVYTNTTVVSARILVPLVVNPIVAAAAGAWTCESEAWTAANGYPSAICFHEQRFLAGGTTLFPTTIWGSQSGDYENIGIGPYDGDALEYRIAANQVNEMRWMLPTKALLVGTAGSEFRVLGGADSPLTPSNVDVKPETTHGSADVSPVRIGHKLVFVQRAGRKVREIGYAFDSDSFLAGDLTTLADHLTETGIVEMAYQQEPESILWCVTADGVLLGLTYNREQEVLAWHWHETDGDVESICVIPDPVNNRDELWLAVKRTIGGATKRYIERMDPDRPNVDSFVLYSGAATVTIPGLSHLEGETVDALADGFVVKGLVVVGGAVTLPRAAAEVVVGLPYESELIPNRAEFTTDKVSTIGKKKHWVSIFLRLLNTAGIEVNGDELAFRTGAAPLGSPPDLFTGDKEITDLGIDTEADIVIKQTNPLPATILCVGGYLDVGE